MSDTVKAALIILVGLIVAAFLNGGIYEIVGASGHDTDRASFSPIWGYRLNRFTGEVMVIAGSEAMIQVPVHERPSKK